MRLTPRGKTHGISFTVAPGMTRLTRATRLRRVVPNGLGGTV